jgi:hypothetical protein
VGFTNHGVTVPASLRANREPASDIVWGAADIGAVIGLSPSKTYHRLISGHIQSARKKGGRWCASRSELLREHGGAPAREVAHSAANAAMLREFGA